MAATSHQTPVGLGGLSSAYTTNVARISSPLSSFRQSSHGPPPPPHHGNSSNLVRSPSSQLQGHARAQPAAWNAADGTAPAPAPSPTATAAGGIDSIFERHRELTASASHAVRSVSSILEHHGDRFRPTTQPLGSAARAAWSSTVDDVGGVRNIGGHRRETGRSSTRSSSSSSTSSAGDDHLDLNHDRRHDRRHDHRHDHSHDHRSDHRSDQPSFYPPQHPRSPHHIVHSTDGGGEVEVVEGVIERTTPYNYYSDDSSDMFSTGSQAGVAEELSTITSLLGHRSAALKLREAKAAEREAAVAAQESAFSTMVAVHRAEMSRNTRDREHALDVELDMYVPSPLSL